MHRITLPIKLILIFLFIIGTTTSVIFLFNRKSDSDLTVNEKEIEEIKSFKNLKTLFSRGGDIWEIKNDLERKIIETDNKITQIDYSPNSQEIYWLNEKGELWKKDKNGEIKSLITVEKDMEEKIQEGEPWNEGFEPFFYLEGKVVSFNLSPDGKYIIYRTLVGYTSEKALFDYPLYIVRIMRNDGQERVSFPGTSRGQPSFVGWLPDSQSIIINFRQLDEPTQSSALFKVDLTGEKFQVYKDTGSIAGSKSEFTREELYVDSVPYDFWGIGGNHDYPIFSHSGEKLFYVNDFSNWTEIWVNNLKTQEKRIIWELSDYGMVPYWSHIFWSDDDNLLGVRERNAITVFDLEGNEVYQTEKDLYNWKSLILDPLPLIMNNKYLAFSCLENKICVDNILKKENHDIFSFEERGLINNISVIPWFIFEDYLYVLINNEGIESNDKKSIAVINIETKNSYILVENISQFLIDVDF